MPQIVGAQPDQAHGRAKIAHACRERPGRHAGVLERAPLPRRPQHRPPCGRISHYNYPAFQILRVVAWRHK